MSPHTQVNASPITKITSWLKFLGKNLHLVGCATLCAKSEVMLILRYYLKDLSVGIMNQEPGIFVQRHPFFPLYLFLSVNAAISHLLKTIFFKWNNSNLKLFTKVLAFKMGLITDYRLSRRTLIFLGLDHMQATLSNLKNKQNLQLHSPLIHLGSYQRHRLLWEIFFCLWIRCLHHFWLRWFCDRNNRKL